LLAWSATALARSSRLAISRVAPLFRAVRDAAARLAALGPVRAVLDCPAQLRLLAMNVAPGGDVSQDIHLRSVVDTARNFHNPSHWCKEPAQEDNLALASPTSMPGDPHITSPAK
jgi:hypothetical protein